MNDNKKYLTETVPNLLKNLKAEYEPSFGIMTAHHMVEHLVWVTKTSIKDLGPAPANFSDKELGFMRFIEKGAHFTHRLSDKKREDIPPPRLDNIELAKEQIPVAVQRLYACSPDRVFYNSMMGKLTFEQMELFHTQHYRYHLEQQFGLNNDDD